MVVSFSVIDQALDITFKVGEFSVFMPFELALFVEASEVILHICSCPRDVLPQVCLPPAASQFAHNSQESLSVVLFLSVCYCVSCASPY